MVWKGIHRLKSYLELKIKRLLFGDRFYFVKKYGKRKGIRKAKAN